MCTCTGKAVYLDAIAIERGDFSFRRAPDQLQFGRTFRLKFAIGVVGKYLPFYNPIFFKFDELKFKFLV